MYRVVAVFIGPMFLYQLGLIYIYETYYLSIFYNFDGNLVLRNIDGVYFWNGIFEEGEYHFLTIILYGFSFEVLSL